MTAPCMVTSKARGAKLLREKAALEEQVKSWKRESQTELRVEEKRLKLQDKFEIERQRKKEAAQAENKRLESLSRISGILARGMVALDYLSKLSPVSLDFVEY